MEPGKWQRNEVLWPGAWGAGGLPRGPDTNLLQSLALSALTGIAEKGEGGQHEHYHQLHGSGSCCRPVTRTWQGEGLTLEVRAQTPPFILLAATESRDEPGIGPRKDSQNHLEPCPPVVCL